MQDDEFARATHTLKGLSASIGAIELNKITATLDKTQDKNILPEFNIELNRVLDDLELIRLNEDKDSVNEDKKILTNEKKDALILKLKEALDSMEPEECSLIIKEFSHYELSDEDAHTFDQIVEFASGYDFDEALALLEKLHLN